MKKRAFIPIVLGVLILAPSLAFGATFVVNWNGAGGIFPTLAANTLSSAISDAGQQTADNNSDGIPDSTQAELLGDILAHDSSNGGKPWHDQIYNAYMANRAKLASESAIQTANALTNNCMTDFCCLYVTIGDDASWGVFTAIAGGIASFFHITFNPNRADYVGVPTLLSASADLDGDGVTNLQEWTNSGQNRAAWVSNVQTAGDPTDGPAANFTWTPSPGIAGLPVQFTDTSIAAGGTITGWAWAFGDTGTSALQNPTHTFASPNTYSVSLTVTATNGTGTKTQSVTVIPNPNCPYAGLFNDPVTGQGHVLMMVLQAVGVTQFGTDWTQMDILGNGFPQDAQMALLEFVLCHDTYRYHQAVHDVLYGPDGASGNKAVFAADIVTLSAINPIFSGLTAVGDLIPALIGTSQAMKDAVNALVLQMTSGATGLPSYASYQLFPNDILAADGDLDGDTLTNQTEYDQVMAVSGNLDAFVAAATDPFNFWPGNPGLPVIGIAGIVALLGAVAVSGRALIRKK